LRNTKKMRMAVQNKGRWMLTSGVVLIDGNASVYSCSHTSTAGVFKLGVVWPPSLQPWFRSERLPPVYLPEEVVVITALQQ
jgi:hypothetical protein